MPPFTVHQAYDADGTFLSFGSDASGAARSPEFGSWERVEGRLYANRGSSFRFNPQTGAHIGYTRINRTIRLSDDGQSFAAISRVLILDLDGNVVTTFRAPSTGVRMQIERIPEQP